MAAKYAPLSAARALAMLVVLGGCSLSRPPSPPPPLGEPPAATGAAAVAPAPAAPAAPPVREYHLGVAAQSLVTQAHAQVARGEVTSAGVTLERALKIEPANPLLWIELARLALIDDPRRAEGYGRKALALAGGDRAARAQAGRALFDALRAQHRDQEARELAAQPWMN